MELSYWTTPWLSGASQAAQLRGTEVGYWLVTFPDYQDGFELLLCLELRRFTGVPLLKNVPNNPGY